jgi:hypothetical protein
MRVQWSWGPNWETIPAGGLSSVALPVGEWFDIEMHGAQPALTDEPLEPASFR